MRFRDLLLFEQSYDGWLEAFFDFELAIDLSIFANAWIIPKKICLSEFLISVWGLENAVIWTG